MNLTISPVTKQTRHLAEHLQVSPDQINFIETVQECMKEADELSDWRPVCIMADNTIVGFSMYGCIQDGSQSRVWFDRFLIDQKYQHHGYGKEAIRLMLVRLRHEFPCYDIYLSAYPENRVAISLYESFGFRFNGELDTNGEHVMVLPADKPL